MYLSVQALVEQTIYEIKTHWLSGKEKLSGALLS